MIRCAGTPAPSSGPPRDALARLPDRAVRQPHERERGQPTAHVHLHRDLVAADPVEGECGDAGEHGGKLGCGPRCAWVRDGVTTPHRGACARSCYARQPTRDAARPSLARMMPDHRQRLGALGERLAAAHLEARGYSAARPELPHPLRRARPGASRRSLSGVLRGQGPRGARGRALEPLAAVGWRKRGQVRRMARSGSPSRCGAGPQPPELRFDAIGITLDPAAG